jgi:hypothetical protein
MATNRYIILANSNASVSKRFKTIQMSPVLERSDEIQRTINGTLDKSAGVITALHQYIIRCPAESADSQYGTYADLKALFLLNNPNGTPSDVITLTDHDGSTHSCLFLGSISPEMLTTMLDGPNAHFFVKIQLGEIAPL